MQKIVFIDSVHPVLWERLEKFGYHCVDASHWGIDQCAAEIAYASGIVIRSRFRLDEQFLKGAKKLEFIARSGAGLENIDVAYCEKRNIELFNAPEGNRNAVAEHALGMLLNLFRNINKGHHEIREGIWDREGNRGVELDGKTVAIIGFGNNGSAFAKKLSGFDVRVLAYDKYKNAQNLGQVESATLEQVFKEADVVSFHIPQNEETLFFGDTNFFDSFQKPIYLLNMSRGKIVKTKDLLHAMALGQVIGACLDVLEFESTSFSEIDKNETLNKLLNHPKVILSPHVAGWTQESYFLLSDVLADKILSR